MYYKFNHAKFKMDPINRVRGKSRLQNDTHGWRESSACKPDDYALIC